MALLTLSKPRRAYGAFLSVFMSAAISPIAIRYAQLEAVPSLYIILVRLFLISLLLMPFVLRMHSQEWRHKLPFLAYSWLVFTSAGLVGFLIVLFTDTSLFGYSSLGYFWVLMATVLGQFLGHLPINAALHYFPATYLSILMQLSVLLSALLAFLFLGQIPSILQSIGSLLALLGIILVIRHS
jgi:drug/metabolite transporter (DMT)-like permease